MKMFLLGCGLCVLLGSTSWNETELRTTEGEGWTFHMLEQAQAFAADDIDSGSYFRLVEIEKIDVAGFRTARVFLKLTEADFHENQGEFVVGKTRLELSAFHNLRRGSSRYDGGEVVATAKTSFSGFVEVPVIGESLRLVVWGHGLPRKDVVFDCSVYLLD